MPGAHHAHSAEAPGRVCSLIPSLPEEFRDTLLHLPRPEGLHTAPFSRCYITICEKRAQARLPTPLLFFQQPLLENSRSDASSHGQTGYREHQSNGDRCQGRAGGAFRQEATRGLRSLAEPKGQEVGAPRTTPGFLAGAAAEWMAQTWERKRKWGGAGFGGPRRVWVGPPGTHPWDGDLTLSVAREKEKQEREKKQEKAVMQGKAPSTGGHTVRTPPCCAHMRLKFSDWRAGCCRPVGVTQSRAGGEQRLTVRRPVQSGSPGAEPTRSAPGEAPSPSTLAISFQQKKKKPHLVCQLHGVTFSTLRKCTKFSCASLSVDVRSSVFRSIFCTPEYPT